ncbi:MAG: DUF3109 family protein, partial [Bacteroidota bacterium]
KLVSDELRSVHFVCDLHACKGACCVEGDSGAPLDPEEREILENIYPQVAPYLSETSRAAIYEQGPWVKDDEGYGTPLVAGKECAYVIHGSDGMAHCGIERAYRDGRIDWPKPISCHLYPVRIKPLGSIEVQALNYDTWDICKPACTLGKELKVPLYKFLKAPLIRKYGERFYRTMEDIFDHWPVG